MNTKHFSYVPMRALGGKPHQETVYRKGRNNRSDPRTWHFPDLESLASLCVELCRTWVYDKGWVYNKYSWASTACVVLAQVGLDDDKEINTDAGYGLLAEELSMLNGWLKAAFQGSFSWFFFFFSFSLQKIQDHGVLDLLGRAVSSCLWFSGAWTSSGWLDGEVVSTSSFLGRCVDSCPPRTGLTCAS